jgi:DNA modification methylase
MEGAKQVEWLETKNLIPYAKNSRTHSDTQVAQIAGSIKEFGFNNPVLIDEDNGIIAGHGRVLAAQKLGLQAVPCIRLAHLSDTQRKAYVIADNRLALNAGWDDSMLMLELQELKAEDFNLDLLGFEAEELNALLNPIKETEGLTDEDAVPEVPEEPKTKLGDIYQLGRHRLMCGDSTSIDAVEKLMDGQKSDMVFTDPPWNVNYGAVDKGNAMGYKPRTILNDHMTDDKWDDFVTGICSALFASSKPGCPIYVVMSAQEWPVLDKCLRQAGFHWSSTIIWAKDRLVLSRKDYHTQYEPIWYGWNESAARLVNVEDRKQSDLWNIERPSKSELHPTTKPVELIERALNNSSKPNANVLDLFGGSGSTMIACEKLGRTNFSMELDPKYCDVIVKRWEEFTGQKANLAEI